MTKRSTVKRNLILQKIFSFFKALFFICLALVLTFLTVFFYIAKDLPRPERFTERQMALPTKIYDRTGQVLLYSIFGEEKREVIPLNEVSDYFKKAVIVAEDRNFYTHFGIDLKSIIRAIMVNLQLKKPVQGGSTIPQQLIRSTFLTPEKTLQRKAREIILTLELDRRYSKEQILEWYLNQVPFGSNTYGVEAASQTFFSKRAKDLSLAEAATLASVIKAPTYYGEHKDELLERKDYILDSMVQEGYIDSKSAEIAKQEKVKFKKASTSIQAPHFILYVKKLLVEKYGEDYLQKEGLRVFTTLDVNLQKLAEETITNGVERNRKFRAYNAALVAISPNTGEILSLVGSADYFGESLPKGCTPAKDCLFEPEFDVAILGLRQPGSAFKPFVYATAFNKGFSDKYVVVDELTNFGVWGGKSYIPQNYDGRFRGPVTLRQALAQSLNVPSIKVLVYLAGIKDSVDMAKKLGITTLREPSYYGPSLVLGGGEVKLLEITSAYGVFATEGLFAKPTAILRIEDSQGNVVEEYKPSPKRVLSSNVAKLINSILSDNETRAPIFGANSPLALEGTSVKTGTTQYFNDAWTIGYSPKLSVGIWVGNNDNSSNYKEPGIGLAAPIWRTFIEKALEKL